MSVVLTGGYWGLLALLRREGGSGWWLKSGGRGPEMWLIPSNDPVFWVICH